MGLLYRTRTCVDCKSIVNIIIYWLISSSFNALRVLNSYGFHQSHLFNDHLGFQHRLDDWNNQMPNLKKSLE